MYYQNVRGLNSKLDLFNNSVCVFDYDFLAFTESWLKASIYNAEIFDCNIFQTFRDNGVARPGGAALLAIKGQFACLLLNLTSKIPEVPINKHRWG